VWTQLPSPDQQSTLLRFLHVEHRYPAGTLDTKEQERAHNQATVEKLHLERLSQRAIARTTGMSRMMVAAGGTYLDPALAGHVVARYMQVPGTAGALLGTELSERETEVMQQIARGYSNNRDRSPAHAECQDGRDLPRQGKAGHR
jgi:hypothetical protein